MKTCAKCGETKDDTAFYHLSSSRDGLYSYCKVCQNAATRSWVERHRDRVKELGREHKARQREREGPEITRQKWKEWYARNAEQRSAYTQERKDPLKVRAHNVLNAAIKGGRVVRPTRCSECGDEGRMDAHHADYSRPLEVEWLCRRCHRLRQ